MRAQWVLKSELMKYTEYLEQIPEAFCLQVMRSQMEL